MIYLAIALIWLAVGFAVACGFGAFCRFGMTGELPKSEPKESVIAGRLAPLGK